jgi:hypothetical protein
MAEALQVVQGDTIERDVSSTTITNFTGWTGKWAISTTIGGVSIKSGALTMSADKKKLQCRVPPYDLADALPIGNVFLEIQIDNASLPFRRTFPQERIEIIAQTITT